MPVYLPWIYGYWRNDVAKYKNLHEKLLSMISSKNYYLWFRPKIIIYDLVQNTKTWLSSRTSHFSSRTSHFSSRTSHFVRLAHSILWNEKLLSMISSKTQRPDFLWFSSRTSHFVRLALSCRLRTKRNRQDSNLRVRGQQISNLPL